MNITRSGQALVSARATPVARRAVAGQALLRPGGGQQPDPHQNPGLTAQVFERGRRAGDRERAGCFTVRQAGIRPSR
ncbi:MAG: hypothetical protein ABIV47_04895 [Roseiflexaceae bacterium]